MSTPAMAFGVGLRNVVVSFWMVWGITFFISRAFLLHESYVAEANKRMDERWLLEKCQEPEFYSNLRQHTDLCTEVARNARSSLLLTALNKVASQTHACGSTSCVEMAFSLFSRLGWQMGIVILLLMVAAPNFVYGMLLHVQRRRTRAAYGMVPYPGRGGGGGLGQGSYSYTMMMDDDDDECDFNNASSKASSSCCSMLSSSSSSSVKGVRKRPPLLLMADDRNHHHNTVKLV